jgi:hypothetical protein
LKKGATAEWYASCTVCCHCCAVACKLGSCMSAQQPHCHQEAYTHETRHACNPVHSMQTAGSNQSINQLLL